MIRNQSAGQLKMTNQLAIPSEKLDKRKGKLAVNFASLSKKEGKTAPEDMKEEASVQGTHIKMYIEVE